MKDFDAVSAGMPDGQDLSGGQGSEVPFRAGAVQGRPGARQTQETGNAARKPAGFSGTASWQPPRLSAGEQGYWRSQEGILLHRLLDGDWQGLHQALRALPRQHPFDPGTIRQLRELTALLSGSDLPFPDPGPAGQAEESLLAACHELGRLLWMARGVSLEAAFELGLEGLSPYLRGDRACRIRLLSEHPLACEPLMERLMQGLGETFGLDCRIGNRFFGVLMYLELRQRPWPAIGEDDFLHLKALAGDQAFFHDLLGCQHLVHWNQAEDSLRLGLTHLWRAYQLANQRVEEPHMELVPLGNGWIEPGEESRLRPALLAGLKFLLDLPRRALAADRFLRILWRQFLARYLRQLRDLAHPDGLAALVRVRDALADEIDERLEFLVANLARRLKQWDLVEKSYLRGLALEPDNLEEMLNLAEYYRGRNRIQEAQALLTKAAKLNPGDQALVANLRSMNRQLELQHLASPFLSHNPPEFQAPRQDLEALEPQALLAVAAMAHALRLNDGGHLRAFRDVEERVFPNTTLCAMMTRELLRNGALLIYRYSPEQSYRILGEWFDFDNDRVEWMLNLNWRGAPEFSLEDAALLLLRHRLAADPGQLRQLWHLTAVHELLYYAQQGFERQGWYLEVTDYAYEVIAGLLESLSLWQARSILDEALAAAKSEQESGNLPSARQLPQAVIRHLQACYERLLLNTDLAQPQEPESLTESVWTLLFRDRVGRLGRLFYETVPGEIALPNPH